MRLEPIEQEKALACWMFPVQWARTESMRSKQRGNHRRMLRARAMELQAISLLTPDAACRNCEHILRNPATLKGTYCDLDSDHSGYVSTKTDDVCSRWRRAHAT